MGLSAPIAELVAIIFSGVFIGIAFYSFRRGKDNSVSLTNVQVILWSGVIIGSYAGIAAFKGGFLGDLPANLLALMGISAGSAVTAASTRHLQSKDRVPYDGPHRTWGMLSSESDPQHLSLPKLQVFFWTIVAILIYVVIVWNNFSSGTAALPDPGSGLVALMGISHGAYLGNKFSDTPKEGGQQIDQFPVSDSSILLSQGLKVLQDRVNLPSVVGIVRKGKLMDLTDSSLTIQAGDIILAFGDSTKLAGLGKLVGSTT